MNSGRYNITIDQGIDFNQVFTYKIGITPVDLTGYTARLNISKKFFKSSKPVIDLTTENSKLVLGGALGTITATISSAETLFFTVEDQYFYDLELVIGSSVSRLLRGKVIIIGDA